MAQFTVRALLLAMALLAGLLSLHILGGGDVVPSTLVIGLVIGGCFSFLFRRSNVRATPTIFAVAGAIVSEILGVYLIDFRVEDWNNPLGKLPWGRDLLFWYAFFGAFVGAGLGLTLCKWRRRCGS